MEDIEDYRKQFIDEIRNNASLESTDPGSYFIERVLSDLEGLGELSDPIPMSVEIRNSRRQILAFDGYSYDEADGALVLIISEFSNQRDNVPALTNTRIEELLSYMQRFIDEAVNGNISNFCDDSDPAVNIANEFRKKIGKGMTATEILRFKFIIISNLTLSKQVKNISQPDFLERPVELNVWTLERFYQTFVSNSSEILEIETNDFDCDGIPCLRADLGEESNYDAYLGIVPGKFLADIYLKYGSKLLQGNVRAFLSFRGNVNKGIRSTIMKEPENFFTYNNGIAIVARAVRFSPDNSKIVFFKDLQIINGGQTTASLASAIIKKEAPKGMDTLYVPMKLTVLNVDDDMSEEQVFKYNSLTKTISECANSQNAVKPADFFSNHPFHVKMEQLSHKVMAPPVGGNPYQTVWFYERSRGKWEQEQMKLNSHQRDLFKEKNPKNQLITKEKLAKCYNAILMHPDQVCKSSADNFKIFAPYIDGIYENDRDSINEEFFKKCVCSIIIFDTLDKLISKEEWYPKGGNKAQITPYTISKLMTLLPKDSDLDWVSIWNKQTLYPALAAELLRLAYFTHRYLEDKAAGGLVRSLSRVAGTWADFKGVSFELSDEFQRSLISKEEIKSTEQAARRAHKFNSNIDASVEIFRLGATYWINVYNAINKEELLSYGDCDFIRGIAECIGRNQLPSPAQCRRLLKIVEKAEDKGYLMP
ncbi:MAG: AIPR family protein [Bacteroidaceae bacterium]|nr:AIPR family protein [Bacteroidaceae bacterium]